MGWYRINPETGGSLEGGESSLSRPADFVLLNAVPGVDDEEEVCYLGDGPSDMGYSMMGDLRGILPAGERLTAAEVRGLLLEQSVPARLKAKSLDLQNAVTAFWRDIDGCYEDDWERPAWAAERRWICEDVVRRFCCETET